MVFASDYTRDFDVDTVRTFLVNLCFCAVAVNTLLQLVDCVFHIFGRRILITHYLICDTYTAGQVQTKCDVLAAPVPVGPKPTAVV